MQTIGNHVGCRTCASIQALGIKALKWEVWWGECVAAIWWRGPTPPPPSPPLHFVWLTVLVPSQGGKPKLKSKHFNILWQIMANVLLVSFLLPGHALLVQFLIFSILEPAIQKARWSENQREQNAAALRVSSSREEILKRISQSVKETAFKVEACGPSWQSRSQS